MVRDSKSIGVDVRATRYASVDLLRGASILVMLVLHAIMDTLDVEYNLARLESGAIINILALKVILVTQLDLLTSDN
jgi:uncharacterized membrane protein